MCSSSVGPKEYHLTRAGALVITSKGKGDTILATVNNTHSGLNDCIRVA